MSVLELERVNQPTSISSDGIPSLEPAVVPEIFLEAFAPKIEISPFLPKNSPLEKAGFLLSQQMESFILLAGQGRLDEAVADLIIEIRAHANEYAREAPLLIGSVKKGEKGIVNKYNNDPVINHLDWTEREGATAWGSVNLNNGILKDKEGDAEVLVSPSGWNGKYHDYEKTQIVFVREGSGEDLDQLTFVLNFRLQYCISVLEEMGVSRADLICADSTQTIKNIASSPVHLDSKTEEADPRKFLSLLKKINPFDPNLKVIERDLERHLRGEDISVLSPVCEGYLEDLEDILFQNADNLGDFKVQAKYSDRVEETIYKIAAYIRGYGRIPNVIPGNEVTPESNVAGFRPSRNEGFRWRDQYRDIIHVLQQISGCAGGGSKNIRSLGGIFSTGFSFSSSGIEGEDYHLGSCVACKRENVYVGACNICQSCADNMN